MKIRPDHYQHMLNAMRAIANDIPMMQANIANDPRVRDSAMRLRWDLCYRANLNNWICANVYNYANDSHIDTALRAIMAEITQ